MSVGKDFKDSLVKKDDVTPSTGHQKEPSFSDFSPSLSTFGGIGMAHKASDVLSPMSSVKESDSDEKKEECLFRCVENGDLRNMEEILSSGKVRLHEVYENKELICGEDRIMVRWCTLIHVAVLKREIKIMKNLIMKGMEINETCCIKNNTSHYYFGGHLSLLTPLMLACVIGDMSAVEFLLENGENSLFMTQRGETALNLAFSNGRVQIIERLMPEIKDYELHERQVPLFFSACFGGLKMVQIWLKIMKDEQTKRKQLDPNYEAKSSCSDRMSTAIYWAVSGVQVDVIDWLCERGFQLSKTNMNHWNVFHALADSNRKEESDRIDLLAWLRERLPLTMIDQVAWFEEIPLSLFEETPLSLVCCSKNFRFARKLLDYGVQRKLNIHMGRKLLLRAISNGDRDFAKCIAELQIEFSGLDFLDKDIHVKDGEVFDSFVTEKLLVAGMPGVFHWAAFYGSSLSLDHLFCPGANLEERDDEGCTPIMQCRTVENLKWFVEHNANYQAVDMAGNSLLHCYGHSSVSFLEYLLDLGLSLEAEDYFGMKPHETASGEEQIFLRSEYEQMILFRLDSERVQPECVQTCLVGEPMAGKTTLTNSLCGITPQSDEIESDDCKEEEEERLYRCVENGELQHVKEILSSGKVRFDQEYKDKELICGEDRIRGSRWKLTHVAVLKRQIEIFKELIRRGMTIRDSNCSIEHSTSHYYFEGYRERLTPFILACVVGDESAVEFLLKNACIASPPRIGDDVGLKLAFANGRVQIAERLALKTNRILLEGSYLEMAPLFFYACFGGLKMVKLWLKIMKNEQIKREQLDPNYEPKYGGGMAAIHWAVAGVQRDVVKWLCDERGFQLSRATSEDERSLNEKRFHSIKTIMVKWNVFHALAESNHKEESDRIDLLAWLAEKLPPAMMDDVAGLYSWDMWTPLSLACRSKNFRFARKLLELGVHRKFDINVGSTLIKNGDPVIAKAIAELKIEFSGWLSFYQPLMHCDKEVLDSFVAEGLLVGGTPCVFHLAASCGSTLTLNHLWRHGTNLDEEDSNGRTPITQCSSLTNVQWFVQRGANYQAVDKEGNSLLHIYGVEDMNQPMMSLVKTSILKYLLNLGLSLEAENDVGKKPHETAAGEMQIFLEAKYKQMLSFRLDGERVQPECVQTCLVGEPMAGKTTLTNSLCGIAPQSDEIQSDELDRTAGVDVHNKQVDGVGLMSIWDFGGHYPFRVAHAILFRFALTIFICVVNLDDVNGKRRAMKEVIAEVRRWLAFLKSARKSIVSGITIVVVGNKRTGDNPDKDTKPSGVFRIQVNYLVEKFEGIFSLNGVVELDCKKRQSPAMNSFRGQLKRIRDDLIQKADPVPKVCEKCRSLILSTSLAEDRLLDLKQFRRTIEKRLRRPLIKDLPIELLAQNLHDSGTILYFRTLRQIYLQPSVLVTNLLGPILSDPEEFYIHAVDDDTGRVNRGDIEVALELFQENQRERNLPCVSFTADEAIRVMLDLHLICQIEGKDGPNSYHVPCLIKESKPAGVWEEEDKMVVYRGRRYRVSHPKTDVIPPPLFPVLQSRCTVISGYRMILWKNGFKLEASGQSHLVECLVEITNDSDAVDVIVRCSKGGECVAKDTLEDVKRTVESVRGDKANGTPMEWCYLDSDDLHNHSSEVAVYERVDVKSCKSNTAIVKARRIRDATYPCIRIIRLRLPRRIGDGEPEHGGRFPADDDVVCKDLIAAICSGASSKWEEICCFLLSAEAVTEIRRGSHSNKVSLALALEKWKTETEQPLVKTVLLACTESSISKRVIQEKYKKVTLLHS